jgi:hypothetical protein
MTVKYELPSKLRTVIAAPRLQLVQSRKAEPLHKRSLAPKIDSMKNRVHHDMLTKVADCLSPATKCPLGAHRD